MSIVYTPGGTTFHSSLTLPSDGDAAVVASVNAGGFQYLADNSGFEALKFQRVYNVLNYGVDNTGVVDALAIVDAIILEALLASPMGGVLLFPPGTYLFSSTVVVPNGVSLIAQVSGTVVWVLNHATNHTIVFAAGTHHKNPCIVIDGINFEAMVPNTGEVFYDAGTQARDVLIRNVSLNQDTYGNQLQGKIFLTEGYVSVISSYTFENVIAYLPSVNGFIATNGFCEVIVKGGRVKINSGTWYALAIDFNGGTLFRIDGLYFDSSLYTSGGGSMLSPSATGTVTNCTFNDGGTFCSQIVLTYAAGLVTMAGNLFQCSIPYVLGSSITQVGSNYDLALNYRVATSSASLSLKEGYASVIISSSYVGGTAITLPRGFFPGQKFDLVYYNGTGSSADITLVGTHVFAQTIPTIGLGHSITASFVWVDVFGTSTYYWFQVGAWCDGGGVIV